MGGGGGGEQTTCDLRSCNKTLALVSFFAAVGGFLFGYDLALIGGALLYIEEDLGIEDEEVGAGFHAPVLSGRRVGARWCSAPAPSMRPLARSLADYSSQLHKNNRWR
jgi:hypothetical protein